MKKTACVILAAGKGVRMKSDMPKALCELSGKAMVEFLIDTALSCGIKSKDIIVVGGHKIKLLRKKLIPYNLRIVEQRRLLGSADAVRQARGHLKNFNGAVLVLYADTPLIRVDTIKAMLKEHKAQKASLTLLTVTTDDPKDYGRIGRDENGNICAIVEHTEILNPHPTSHTPHPTPHSPEPTAYEINVGAYCFDSKRLFEGLSQIKMNKIKKEFYLTDIVAYFYKKGYPITSYITGYKEQTLGINRRSDLIRAEGYLREWKITDLLNAGVTIKDPATTYIQQDVRIARDTVIYPFTVIEHDVIVGKRCRIGPFAHLRPGTVMKDGSEIGNFVEVVRSEIGTGSKAKHHTYLGDTIVGKNVNVGAGTITANYDGKRKSRTIIDDGAFIGSSTTIVAPVKIGKKAVTGAGSVVVKGKDVPANTVVVGVPARPLIKDKKS